MWQPYGSNITEKEDQNLKYYYDDMEVLDLLNDLSNCEECNNYDMQNDPLDLTVKSPDFEEYS